MNKAYPKWKYSSRKNWLKHVRKRWIKFRKEFEGCEAIHMGSAFYPSEVQQWIREFNKIDGLMKEYYKNA